MQPDVDGLVVFEQVRSIICTKTRLSIIDSVKICKSRNMKQISGIILNTY